MHRESPRLQENGYYSKDGSKATPTQRICYYETPFRRTKRSRVTQLQARPQMSPSSTECSYDADEFMLADSGRDVCRPAVKTSSRRPKSFASLPPTPLLLLLLLLLLLGSLCFWVFSPQLSSITLMRPLTALRSIYNRECQPPQQRTEARSQTPELQPDLQELVRKLVQEHTALANTNDKQGCSECRRPTADKMADFALESQGASVITSRCSQTYTSASPRLTIFGIPLFNLSRGPRTVIQGSLRHPGECWSFVGSKGTLAVSLSHPIRITHVTMEHAQRSHSPTGEIKSAPRDFEVYGIKIQLEKENFLGNFTYDQFGEPSQTFVLKDPGEEVYEAVELHVLTNWGQEEYTCLYRFRVHGHMASTS